MLELVIVNLDLARIFDLFRLEIVVGFEFAVLVVPPAVPFGFLPQAGAAQRKLASLAFVAIFASFLLLILFPFLLLGLLIPHILEDLLFV